MAFDYEEAKADLKNIDNFCHAACIHCSNDWFCPTDCEMLKKARKMNFDLLIKCYARNEGDWSKIFRYIKRTNRV